MARQYLAEGLKGSSPFIADASKIVTESLPDGSTRTRIPGRFSVCDEVNGNGRRYGRKVWEKNLQPGSALTKSIGENATWGLLEHPKDGQVSLNSPICIRTIKAELRENRTQDGKSVWEVAGEISILNPKLVPEAGRLVAMIEEGYCPRVSSRGFGSLVRAADGVDDVQDDYICEGWDVVLKPSFESAVLSPTPESTKTTESTKPVPAAAPLAETAPVTTVPVITNSIVPGMTTTSITVNGLKQVPVGQITPTGSETKPQSTLAAEAQAQAAAQKPKTEPSQANTMNLSEIKTQVASYRSVDPSKLPPQRFAEGMSQLSSLHQSVADYIAEDPKRSWQGQQLHDEIKALETSWSETQLAPGKRAAKLTEDRTKLMQVIKAVASTALSFKNKIGEAAKQQNRQAALLREVTERGQLWRQQAKALESEAAKYRRRFMMASEALHQFATKYKTDITEMGRAHLTLEFKEKASTPEFQALLKEAKKPKALVPVRLALEGQITAEVAKSILDGKVSLDETLKSLPGGAAAAPGKTGEFKQSAAPPVAEGKKAGSPAKTPAAPVGEGVTIVNTPPGDPRQLSEAIGMVNRLSKAATT